MRCDRNMLVSARLLAHLSFLAFTLCVPNGSAHAQSNNVRITKLSDVSFGLIADLGSHAVRSQDVCLFAQTATRGYNIRGVGSGPGGSYDLTSGSTFLPYEVQWSSVAGRTTGSDLPANGVLTGQISSATQQECKNGPSTSASLIVILSSDALSSATAGSYSGTLTLVVGPE